MDTLTTTQTAEQTKEANIPDDRRIKLLNFLLEKNKIPKEGEFDLRKLIAEIRPEEYEQLFAEDREFETVWRDIDMPRSLTNFLVDHDLAKQHGEHLQLTGVRGQDLQKQGNYGKLLADERYITSERAE